METYLVAHEIEGHLTEKTSSLYDAAKALISGAYVVRTSKVSKTVIVAFFCDETKTVRATTNARPEEIEILSSLPLKD